MNIECKAIPLIQERADKAELSIIDGTAFGGTSKEFNNLNIKA